MGWVTVSVSAQGRASGKVLVRATVMATVMARAAKDWDWGLGLGLGWVKVLPRRGWARCRPRPRIRPAPGPVRWHKPERSDGSQKGSCTQHACLLRGARIWLLLRRGLGHTRLQTRLPARVSCGFRHAQANTGWIVASSNIATGVAAAMGWHTGISEFCPAGLACLRAWRRCGSRRPRQHPAAHAVPAA